MAEVLPLRALHYDLERVSSLGDVTSPPYDVIDEAGRAELASLSPHNVVEVDLPTGDDPYEHAAELVAEWTTEGVLALDEEPAIWAHTQDYTAPDGRQMTRKGFFGRVRVEDYGPGKIRPHERTQPGPKEDRLRLTRATRHNMSPIFGLYDSDAWPLLEGATSEEPWGEVTDPDGTVHRLWRIADPDVHAAVTDELSGAEILIADGHHRYETSRAYAEEIGGEGPHRYVLMNLVSLSDPGLTVFPTHRLVKGLRPEQHESLAEGLRRLFEIEEVPVERLAPADDEPGDGVFGYIDAHFKRPFRLRLKDAGSAQHALADKPEPYRHLDPAILEALVLKDVLGMTEDDIAAKRGIGYAKGADAAVAALDDGYDCAFLLRSTPLEQVREIAASGENMPPKSTYFFPKLLTGLLFNPLDRE